MRKVWTGIVFLFCAALTLGFWVLSARLMLGDLAAQRARVILDRTEKGDSLTGKGNMTHAELVRTRKEAAEVLLRGCTLNPASGEASFALTRYLIQQEDFENARRMAQHTARCVTSIETLNQMGWIAMQLGDHDLARKCYQSTLSISPDNREALEMIVWLSKLRLAASRVPQNRLYATEEMLTALKELQRFTLHNPNTAYLWGQYWTEKGRAIKKPYPYAAGYRVAAQAANWPNPQEFKLLFSRQDAVLIMNYFLMGARGLNVPDDGTPFRAEPPINTSLLRYPD